MMDCNQIASRVDANREFFRKKWDEFCQLVESSAERLNSYQQRRPRKWTGPARDDREWEEAVRRTSRLRERLYAKGWVKWGGYDLEALLQPEDAFCSTYLGLEPYAFFSPADAVNPINWLLGRKNPQSPSRDEQILVSCARLVMAHDSVVATINRICPLQGYSGKHFEYDAFYWDMKQKLPAMVKDGILADAWDDVRLFLEADLSRQDGTAEAARWMVFSEDYHKAAYGGLEMEFNDHQATIVKILAEGKPVDERTLGAAIGSYAKSYRLLDSFRVHGKYHDAWRHIKKVSKGVYRLNVPAKMIQP